MISLALSISSSLVVGILISNSQHILHTRFRFCFRFPSKLSVFIFSLLLLVHCVTDFALDLNFDAVTGDVMIVGNRSQYIDFTMPYTESGLSMAIPIQDDNHKNTWLFVKPLTWEPWLTTCCSFVFIGVLIWILEHQINEDFRGPFWYQVGMIFWFAFSTMVFAHKERLISNFARCVLIIWFLVVLILTQSYTASLASMLTVQKLLPKVKDVSELIKTNENVRYMQGSFALEFLKSLKVDESQLSEYSSMGNWMNIFPKGVKMVATVLEHQEREKLRVTKEQQQ